jgi:hypothetical protein
MSSKNIKANNRDIKYIDKKRYHGEGADELIIEVIKLLSKSVENKINKSEQISAVEKFCLSVAQSTKIKDIAAISLADTIYTYAIGSGYLRVEKGRVSLTQKSKKILHT